MPRRLTCFVNVRSKSLERSLTLSNRNRVPSQVRKCGKKSHKKMRGKGFLDDLKSFGQKAITGLRDVTRPFASMVPDDIRKSVEGVSDLSHKYLGMGRKRKSHSLGRKKAHSPKRMHSRR